MNEHDDKPAAGGMENLIRILARLPGLGPRSARRAVLYLLKRRQSLMEPLAEALRETAASIKECATCHNLDVTDPCHICASAKRDGSIICVVEDVGDLWAMERVSGYSGLYHVLGGTLSALDGIGPDDLAISGLLARAGSGEVKEVIIATNPTVDGQTTAHYIADLLADMDITVSALAQGVPLGGEIDYLDEGTLGAALKSRKTL